MSLSKNRLAREEKTFRNMADIYCRNHHGPVDRLCNRCEELVRYVIETVATCPYGDEKPVCGKCTTHCYDQSAREEVRKVMAFAGPRMLMLHPVLAIRHCMDAMKK